MRVLVVAEGKHERSGALEALLRRLGGEQATFESDRVQNNRIHTHPGKGPKYLRRALAWLRYAQNEAYDALVLLIDEDGQPERIAQFNDAQAHNLYSLPRALGVAIRSFDAWMLADEKALTCVLGCQIDKQSDPETIRNPKQRCADLLEESPNRIAQSEMYAKVCECVDLDVLSARCKKGFAPFSERIRDVFKPS